MVLATALTVITALGWLYLYRSAAMMHATAADAAVHAAMGMEMSDMSASEGAEFVALWVMWAVMMAAMMLASTAPVALLVLATYRRRHEHAARFSSVMFVAGYLVVWTSFSAAAAIAQLLLHRATLLSPEMVSTSRLLAAGVLAAAGIYQFLPLKNACLAHCQSPIEFVMSQWKDGVRGAFTMGLRHGMHCLGCCWMLMTLLFVGGVMNLIWIAAIAVFVLLEKHVPWKPWPSRIAGLVLVGWAATILAAGFRVV